MSGARYEIATAPAHLHLPLLLELWTGQRQGDLLRLAWSTYDGSAIRLRPRKTITRKRPRGKTVTVPVGAPLKAALDELAKSKKSPVILLTTEGTPWDRGGLARIVQQARDAAGIVGVTFNDLENALQNQLAVDAVRSQPVSPCFGKNRENSVKSRETPSEPLLKTTRSQWLGWDLPTQRAGKLCFLV